MQKKSLDIIHAEIFNGSDKPLSDAFVRIRDGKITEIGSMLNYLNAGFEVMDIENRILLPGFVDAHAHFIQGGFFKTRIDFSHCRSKEEFIEIIASQCHSAEPGEWVVGMGYDHTGWKGGEHPHREWLDPVSPENPVICIRGDGHVGIANSVALRIVGFNESTEINGGVLFRDSRGRLTGLLKDAALYKLLSKTPALSMEGFKKALKESTETAIRSGLTTVGEMGDISDPESWQYYIRAYQEKLYSVRLAYYPEISNVTPEILSELKKYAKNDLFKFAGIKVFLDGSLGAQSARFQTPYLNSDDTGIFSSFVLDQKRPFMERLKELDRKDLDFAIHAIGDAAVEVFAKIARELKKNKTRKRRIRCEHFQHIHPEIWKRLPRDSVVLSVQPYHAIDDARWIRKVRPENELEYSYPLRSILLNGFHLALGTDYPVAPLEPMRTISAAVNRNAGKNRYPFLEKEAITLNQALTAYTYGSAYALGMEKTIGKISPGYKADLIVLPENLFRMNPSEIDQCPVLATFFNGEMVHCSL